MPFHFSWLSTSKCLWSFYFEPRLYIYIFLFYKEICLFLFEILHFGKEKIKINVNRIAEFYDKFDLQKVWEINCIINCLKRGGKWQYWNWKKILLFWISYKIMSFEQKCLVEKKIYKTIASIISTYDFSYIAFLFWNILGSYL